jgi:hypothetical protein
MKAQGAAIQGGLAVLALIAAYTTWQREPVAKDETPVLSLSKNDIELIRYDDARHSVELQRSIEEGSPIVWVRERTKEPPPKPVVPTKTDGGIAGAGTDAGVAVTKVEPPDAGVKSEPKVKEFRGNEQADKLYERFASLSALRSLGVLDPKKLKEVGLENSDRRLEIKTRSSEYNFAVGTSALGAGTPYLRNEKDGRVYLLKGNVLSDLEFATSRLIDRRLHTFKPEDWDGVKVTVTAGNQSRELVPVANQKLAYKGQTTGDDFAKNWHDKVWRAVAIDSLAPGERPSAGEPAIELKLDYSKGAKKIGWLELGKAGTDFYARTEHTRAWSRISGGEDWVTEAKKVVASK